MQRFKNILLIQASLVGSRSVLRHAVSLARSNRARLTAVEVAPYLPSGVQEHSALLMRKFPCPVWVVKPGRRSHYKRVLAAVDVDEPNSEAGSLNQEILGIALSLARLEQSELHVFHAWSCLGDSLRGRFGSSIADEWLQDTRRSRKSLLNTLLEWFDLKGVSLRTHLAKGDPRLMIPRFAKRKGIDVIVMGTVCRTGISGFLIGNTAKRILQKVNCSVLALKPYGFVTPVSMGGR